MTYLIILMTETYKSHMFYSAFRSHIQDSLQNQIFKKIAFVVMENSTHQQRGDIIVDTGACHFQYK